MGAEQSKGKTIEQFRKEYEEVRTEYDNRVGEVKIYKSKKNPDMQVMSKVKTFQRQGEFDKFLKKIKKRKILESANVTPLLLTIGKFKIGIRVS